MPMISSRWCLILHSYYCWQNTCFCQFHRNISAKAVFSEAGADTKMKKTKCYTFLIILEVGAASAAE